MCLNRLKLYKNTLSSLLLSQQIAITRLRNIITQLMIYYCVHVRNYDVYRQYIITSLIEAQSVGEVSFIYAKSKVASHTSGVLWLSDI